MRVIAAYLLAVLGGKSNPTAKDLNAIFESVGVKAEAEKVDKLIAELSGKSLEEVIAKGREDMATVPAGGVAAAAAAPAAGGEAKEEKKKEESEEEGDDDMGFGLFD